MDDEVIEYLYDPTEGVDGDSDDGEELLNVYLQPTQTQSAEQSHIEDNSSAVGGLQCPHCDRSFKRQNGLVLHLRTHSESTSNPKPSLFCVECDKKFSSRQSLAAHLRRHGSAAGSAGGTFICHECGKVFDHGNQLAAHLHAHGHSAAGDRKPFPCSLCSGCCFTSLEQLDNHVILEHAADSDNVFHCLDCDEEYTEVTGLTDHVCRKRRLKSTALPKKFKCAQCGRMFGSQSNLSSHARTHTGKQ